MTSAKRYITFSFNLPSASRLTVESAKLRVYTTAASLASARVTVHAVDVTKDAVNNRRRRRHRRVAKRTVTFHRARWQNFDVTSLFATTSATSNANVTFELSADSATTTSLFHVIRPRDGINTDDVFLPKLEILTRHRRRRRVQMTPSSDGSSDVTDNSYNNNNDNNNGVRDSGVTSLSPCALNKTWVTYEQLGFRGARGVDGREGFDFAFCGGVCSSAPVSAATASVDNSRTRGYSSSVVHTNHAKYRALLRAAALNSGSRLGIGGNPGSSSGSQLLPGLCCTPSAFASVTIVRFDSLTNTFVTSQLTDMVATRCACQ